MTVPASGGQSVVVGADLFEFLSLGARRGYFALEQLAYDPGLETACGKEGSSGQPITSLVLLRECHPD